MVRATLKTRPLGRVARAKRAKAAPDIAVHDAFENSEVDEEADQESDLEDEDGGSSRDGMGHYFRTLRDAAELLTPEEELALARRMIGRVVALIREDLEGCAAVLAKVKAPASPQRATAEAFIRRFNPRGLKDRALDAFLLDALYAKRTKKIRGSEHESGSEVAERYIDEDPEAFACKKRFIESNLRIVITMAKRHRSDYLPFAELVQEGNLGLIHAVPRYDFRRGFRFSTYAVWWIRHAIGRAIADKGREVRLPVHLIEFSGLVARLRHELTRNLGRPPSDEELARKCGVSVEKLGKLRQHLLFPTSLDKPTLSGGDDDLHEYLPIEAAEADPWETIVDGRASVLIREACGALSPIERDVIMRRFGFTDTSGEDGEATLREIATDHDLSRERIRQIQDVALKKLKRRLGSRLSL